MWQSTGIQKHRKEGSFGLSHFNQQINSSKHWEAFCRSQASTWFSSTQIKMPVMNQTSSSLILRAQACITQVFCDILFLSFLLCVSMPVIQCHPFFQQFGNSICNAPSFLCSLQIFVYCSVRETDHASRSLLCSNNLFPL